MEPKLLASDTPELAPPATGCPFQRRCPNRIGEICEQEMPPWQSPANAQEHQIRGHIPIRELLAAQIVEEARR
jgi:peptide/nickel transport system ATP-binding protein